jgi:competence ComEA-like helix-hairpin-helix protein
MNRYFDFSPPQIKAIIFLSALLFLGAAYSFISGFSRPDDESLRFSIQVGDDDIRYQPIFKVDPNHSPIDSLELLPGIGPVLAARIVAYRDSLGPFEKPEDIVRVHGIGPALYEKIRPYLEINPW